MLLRNIRVFTMNWRKPIIFVLLSLSRSRIPRYLKKIKELDRYSGEKIKKYQEKKLKKMLLHASKNVPYYNEILQVSGAMNHKKVHLENFDRIPFLTKDIIREQGKNLYSMDYEKRKPYKNSSGGSTGEPVRFIQDKRYREWNIANKLWIKLKAGQDIGDKELRFWGSERDLLEGKESFKIRFRNWIYNRKELNTFKISKKDMADYAEKINDYCPLWIEAYVQPIYEFAKFIRDNDIYIHSPKNGILTSAGTLHSDMKKLIEKVFRCQVYNRYGSREVGDMACGVDSLKISFWNHHVEVINGKLYVTNLNNYAMPFIRYDIGDMAELSENGIFLENIEGRVMSVCRTKEGKIVPAEFFIHFVGVVHNKGSIDKFQVKQTDYDQIELKVIVKDKQQFLKDKEEIEKSIKKEMNNNVNIDWLYVDNIKESKSGKYEYVRCEI